MCRFRYPNMKIESLYSIWVFGQNVYLRMNGYMRNMNLYHIILMMSRNTSSTDMASVIGLASHSGFDEDLQVLIFN